MNRPGEHSDGPAPTRQRILPVSQGAAMLLALQIAIGALSLTVPLSACSVKPFQYMALP